jgi:hypothetical protein
MRLFISPAICQYSPPLISVKPGEAACATLIIAVWLEKNKPQSSYLSRPPALRGHRQDFRGMGSVLGCLTQRNRYQNHITLPPVTKRKPEEVEALCYDISFSPSLLSVRF